MQKTSRSDKLTLHINKTVCQSVFEKCSGTKQKGDLTMKRILTFVLTLTMALSFCVNSFAEATTASTAQTGTSGTQTATSATQADSSEAQTAASTAQTDSSKAQANTVTQEGISYGISNLSGAPDIVAESAVIMDANSGTILYGKEANTKRYPASITKVMTALLAVENCNMSDIITYSNSAVNGIEAGSSTAGINVGAKLTVEDSLYALMLVSANEAAAAIAEHISGSTAEFAKLMTKRAKELGCTNTQFKNPHGLPDEEHYTTAHDMGLILKEAMKYQEFRKIAGTISYTLKKSDTLKDTLELWNHAKILRQNSDYYYENAEGSKTGFTQAALNTLVTYAKKDNVELLCVILKDHGADHSYTDTANLFKWAFNQVKSVTPLTDTDFSLKTVMTENKSIKSTKLDQIQLLNCSYDTNFSVLVKKNFDASSFKTSFKLDEDKKAGRLGYIVISCDGKDLGRTAVTYDTTSKQGKAYLEGKSLDDNLKTAPVESKRKDAIHKGIAFSLRFLIAVILIILIMHMIHRHELEKKRKERMAHRKKR